VTCPIPGCPTKAPPRGILCPVHWQLVPQSVRVELAGLYDPALEPDRQSPRYLATAAGAVDAAARAWRAVMVVPRLKVLTLYRPWAWLVAAGHKAVENRRWGPPAAMVGQRIAIHAGATIDRRGSDRARAFGIPVSADAWAQGIVGLATIDRVLGIADAPALPSNVFRWFEGPLGWVLRDAIQIPAVPVRGQQGLWLLDDADARVVWYRAHVAQAMRA
jgi:hypothetical protein